MDRYTDKLINSWIDRLSIDTIIEHNLSTNIHLSIFTRFLRVLEADQGPLRGNVVAAGVPATAAVVCAVVAGVDLASR